HGEAATDHLAHRGQVRLDVVPVLGAAVAGPESDDFIENEEGAMLAGPLVQRAHERPGGRHHAKRSRHQVSKTTAKLAAVRFQNGEAPPGSVKGITTTSFNAD